MAKSLSTFVIAEMLHVDPGSVANWIDQGLLTAHRTPGGHRRVKTEDLKSFLREYKMPVPAELGGSRTKILIVDDEAPVAHLIAQAVKDHYPDFEIAEAHTGFNAGSQIATLRPDVVILDLKMPDMDGFEVCRLIKSKEHTKHAEVIALTAHQTPENERRIMDCGARVCLSKPVDFNVLIAEIEESL